MKVFGVVYLVWNLVNGKKYVGQTIKTVKARFKEHARSKFLLGKAIRKYSKENFRYGVIKSCASKEELDYWEKHFIAVLRCKSPIGYNCTDGGDGTLGWKHTQETRAQMSAANLGEKNPYFGHHHTEEELAKISAAARGNQYNLGKHHTAESIEKLRVANTGQKHTPETCKKISASKKGKSFSPEHCAKISAAKKGKPLSPEARAKRLGKNIGHKVSKETCAKIGASNRKVVLYKNLLEELMKRQLTYSALDRLLGLSLGSIGRKMRGKTKFTDKDKAKLIEIFGLPIEYLLWRDEG